MPDYTMDILGKRLNSTDEELMEGEIMENQAKVDPLKPNEVRFVELSAMRVVSCKAFSNSPENDAIEKMSDWVKKHNIEAFPYMRYFGFNNPNPAEGKSEYGYEIWVTVPDTIEEKDLDEGFEFKETQAGLYAVTSTSYDNFDVGERWHMLWEWVQASEYEMGKNQWLEEHISPRYLWDAGKLQLDLYVHIV